MKEAKQIIAEILSERIALNPSYSLRAFARDLGVSAQQLSNVINGRRGFGPLVAERLTKRLALDTDQKEMFLESLRANFSKSKVQRVISRTKLLAMTSSAKTKNLELDLFKVISNWHHFTLIEVIKISAPKNQKPLNFAKRLGIPEAEVKLALKRLESLELISKTTSGWKVNQDVVIADRGIPTDAIKKYHQQILEKAIQALAFQAGDERYGSTSTIPIKVKDLALAKELIQKFRTDFNKIITDPLKGEEVYGLSVQFFKLTN